MTEFVGSTFGFTAPGGITVTELLCGSGTTITASNADISIDLTAVGSPPATGDWLMMFIASTAANLEAIDRGDGSGMWASNATWELEERPRKEVTSTGTDNYAWIQGKRYDTGSDPSTMTWAATGGKPFNYCLYKVTGVENSATKERLSYQQGYFRNTQTTHQMYPISVPPGGIAIWYFRSTGAGAVTFPTGDWTLVKDDQGPGNLGTILRRINMTSNWARYEPSATTTGTPNSHWGLFSLYPANGTSGTSTTPETVVTWDYFYKKNTGMFSDATGSTAAVRGDEILNWDDATANDDDITDATQGVPYFPPLGDRSRLGTTTEWFHLPQASTSITAMEVFCTFDCEASNTSATATVFHYNDDNMDLEFEVDLVNNQARALSRTQTPTTVTATVSIDPRTKHYALLRVDGSNLTCRVDNSTSTVATNLLQERADPGRQLMRGRGGANQFYGSIHDFGLKINSAAISSGDKTTLANYAKHKYGIIEAGTIEGDVS